MITKYHAKYYANVLAGQALGGNIDSLFSISFVAIVRKPFWKVEGAKQKVPGGSHSQILRAYVL